MSARMLAGLFLLAAFAAPCSTRAEASIIGQYSGVAMPYMTSYGPGIDVAAADTLIATGTLTSVTLPLASTRGILGTDRISVRLQDYYHSRWLDCQTGQKTVDELGMTLTIKDPNAPAVTFGPFTGTQCDIVADLDGSQDRTLVFLKNGIPDGTLGAMGTASHFNWTAYGPDVPATSTPPDPCATPGVCSDNVLFLPGIEGSRLYQGPGCGGASEERLWEPLADSVLQILRGAGDDKVEKLLLDDTGHSICEDIYTKENDILDTAGGKDLYQPLIDELDALVADGTIDAWKAVPYDWRLSLDDLLANGAQTATHISYTTATDTPYIEQTLRSLAATSKTGKVTIVAHSNGGLVAKALARHLGDEVAATLIDRILLVGVPQTGTPEGLGAILYGLNQGVYFGLIPIFTNAIARSLALNAPMAYHLLPSEDYLESTLLDRDHPVVRFSGEGYAKEMTAYGSTIASRTALASFISAAEGGRSAPDASDVAEAAIGNATLLSYAASTHASLDAWVPPTSIEVDQIAGWGVGTLAGIDFNTLPALSGVLAAAGPVRSYEPIFTEDGDGTVTVPSALAMAESSNVKRYWVDLARYNRNGHTATRHADIFAANAVQDLVTNLITNSDLLPNYVSTAVPDTLSDVDKLIFALHSPLAMQLQDTSGNITGLSADGYVTENISDSVYGQIGEVQYVIVPRGPEYQLTLTGQGEGTFSLGIQEYSNGTIVASSTLSGIPVNASTIASLTISDGIATASELVVDEDGDGANIIRMAPVAGEITAYELETPEIPDTPDAPETSSLPNTQASASESPGAISMPVIATTTEVISPEFLVSENTINSVATTTTEIETILEASTTPEVTQTVEVSDGEEDIEMPDVPTPTKKKEIITTQTAAVYEAVSQHSWFIRLTNAFYTGVHKILARLAHF